MHMAKTRRTQVLLEPETYDHLEQIAQREDVSVAELIRRAVRETFFSSPASRRRAFEEICSMEIPVGDWEDMEREIIDAKVADLPR
jgi:predicted DNA-binding ribbon-helix-helix protein